MSWLAFACSKSTRETQKVNIIIVTKKAPEQVILPHSGACYFQTKSHIFFNVSTVDFEHVIQSKKHWNNIISSKKFYHVNNSIQIQLLEIVHQNDFQITRKEMLAKKILFIKVDVICIFTKTNFTAPGFNLGMNSIYYPNDSKFVKTRVFKSLKTVIYLASSFFNFFTKNFILKYGAVCPQQIH